MYPRRAEANSCEIIFRPLNVDVMATTVSNFNMVVRRCVSERADVAYRRVQQGGSTLFTKTAASELNRAIETYNKLAKVRPDSPLPFLRLSEVHVADKDLAAARASLRKVLAMKPDSVEAHRSVNRCLAITPL
jgi:hypothetical protein